MVILDFSRSGKSADNAPIKSVNGKLGAEFLSPNLFTIFEEAQVDLESLQ